MICTRRGCTQPAHARGLCRVHYERARGMRLIDTSMRDAAPTVNRIALHLARGGTIHHLAHQSGVDDLTVRAIHAGRVKTVRQATADAIAAAPLPPTAVGTVRRVQAMARLGWSRRAFAHAAGISEGTLSAAICRGRIHPRLAAAVADAYERLSGTVGPSSKSVARRAARDRWAPPIAWEDVDIDDPAARPDFGPPDTGRPRIDLDEVAFLLSGGCSVEEAARKVGCNPGSIRKAEWHLAHGRGAAA